MRCFDTPIGKAIVRFIFSDRLGRDRIKKFISHARELSRCKNVLDVGCGLCHDKGLFGDLKYTGIDINSDYLTASYKKRREGKKLVVADSRKLPFHKSCFDLVYSNSIFHHMNNSSFENTLKGISFVLKPGRFLVLIDAIAPRSKKDYIGRFLRRLDAGKFIRSEEKMAEILKKDFFIQDRFFWKAKGIENCLFLLRKK